MQRSGARKPPLDETSLDSISTYAVVWDPADGMELFSGNALDELASYEHPNFERTFDEETLADDTEPFAVFGSRAQHFIGIHSLDKYDRYMRGVDVQSVLSILDYSLPTSRPEDSFGWTKIKMDEERRRSTSKTSKNPQTPCSIFTFAAVWDPDTGLTAYEKGKLLPLPQAEDFVDHPSRNSFVDTSVSNLAEGQTTTRLYLSQLPKLRFQDHPITSSTLEGLADTRSFPFIDPHRLPAELREPHSGFTVYDKDIFESLSDRPDFEQPLPSRFSMTTTSTSNYIEVDLRASILPLQQSPTAFNHPTSPNQTTKSPTFKREKPIARLSRAIKGRWSRRALDEHWVFVEVQSVITDRILEE